MSSERILKLQTENVDTLSRLFGLNEENSIVNTMRGNFSGTKVTV